MKTSQFVLKHVWKLSGTSNEKWHLPAALSQLPTWSASIQKSQPLSRGYWQEQQQRQTNNQTYKIIITVQTCLYFQLYDHKL